MTGRCLVTGASGFIGGHLVERLVEQGTPVRCLARAESDTGRLRRLGVQIAVGDLTDAGSVRSAADGCEYVLHCAALVSDWATVPEMRRVNVQGTRNVLDAALAASTRRVIHFSSTDVYGHPGTREIDETYRPRRVSNWYSRTKLEAERELTQARRGAVETVILRPATIFGPRSVNVVGEIAQAIAGGQMLLIDGGRAVAGLCYIDNLIDAAILTLEHPAATGQTFNVTDGLDVTWRQFIDDLAGGLGHRRPRWNLPYGLARPLGLSMEQGYRLARRLTGVRTEPLLSRQAVEVMGRDQSFSNAKIRQRLGWEPRVGYAAGLEATLTWLRAGSDLG